jgi:hypothetical protein
VRVLLLFAVALPAVAAAGEPDQWLDGLYRRVAADLNAGRPLVATVHVALCSNEVIRCGGHGLGDGDSLRTNLYWATTGGFDGWFSRAGSGWRRARVDRPAGGAVLATVVWERRVTPGTAWRKFGVTRPFTMYVVAHAWRGSAIDGALDAFVDDLYAAAPSTIGVGGTAVDAGGASHLVAFVGHDRFMDRPPYDFAAAAGRAGRAGRPKGMMALACATDAYLGGEASAARRVPLVLTTDLMFASSPAFDYAARAFADAAGYPEIRRAAAEGYAAEQHKPIARCQSLFTNPSRPERHR